MKKVPILLAMMLVSVSANADVYIKARAAGGMGENETWTSGKKQRVVTHVPMAAEMIGDQIEITRTDKGVKWEINPRLHAYQETAIPIEYKPEDNLDTPEGRQALNQFTKEVDKSRDVNNTAACSKVVTLPDPCPIG